MVWLLLHLFPALLPPLIPALGWSYLLGPEGLFGSEMTSRMLFSGIGVVFVLTLTFLPIVTIIVMSGLKALDPALEEAGRIVAGPWSVGFKLLVPAIWPSLTLAGIIVFTLAFSEIGVPMLMRVQVYPSVIFSRIGGHAFEPSMAAVLVLPLLIVAIFLFSIDRLWLDQRSFGGMVLSRPPKTALFSGKHRPLTRFFCISASMLSVIPFLELAHRALSADFFNTLSGALPSLWNSVSAAGLTATLLLACALPICHSLARKKLIAKIVDAFLGFGFFLPSAVLGIGLIGAWNRPATEFVYGSELILILGYLMRYAVVGVRALAASIVQSPESLEDAARAYGAGYLRILFYIIVPMHRRGLVLAWLLVFAFSMRDLETAVMYYPPGTEPLSVRFFTLEANSPVATMASLACLQVAVTACIMAGLFVFSRRSGD